MELPPLSPGIHDNVMDVVVVLVTVRRGWSGGTEGSRKVIISLYSTHSAAKGGRTLVEEVNAALTLDLQIERDLI